MDTTSSHHLFVVAVVLVATASAMIGPISGQQQIVCPKPEDYFPCRCVDYGSASVYLFCDRQNMRDDKISQILQAYLATPGVSPLSFLQLQYNQLSRVPQEIHLFPQLNYVNLEYNNIENVQTAAFNFTATLYQLYLSSNPLVTIEPDAFAGNYGQGSEIFLQYNSLSRFDADVFQSVLEKMRAFSSYPYAYIDIRNNPIDCVSDPCHLAWLIRDNQELMHNHLFGGICSNGVAFEDLNPNSYNNCSSSSSAAQFLI